MSTSDLHMDVDKYKFNAYISYFSILPTLFKCIIRTINIIIVKFVALLLQTASLSAEFLNLEQKC